jgi:hypothetical protein
MIGQAHADRAEREQRDDVRARGVRSQVVQLVGAQCHDEQTHYRRPPRSDAVVEPPGDRHQHGHHQRLGKQHKPGVECAEALGVLKHQRHVEQHPEQADRQHRDDQK